MPRHEPQKHMDDQEIEDPELLAKLVDWEDAASKNKVTRDIFSEQDKRIKGIIIDMELPPGRVRVGPFLIKLADVEAGTVTSRRRARRTIKIDRAK